MCQLYVYSFYRGWKEAYETTCAISITPRREFSVSIILLQVADGNSHHSDKNITEHEPSYAAGKNWVTQIKRGDFSTCVAPRLERANTVATPEITEEFYELILEDRRISGKSLAEQISISRERVGSIIQEYLDNGSAPRSGSRNAWTQIKNVNVVSLLSNIWNVQAVGRMKWHQRIVWQNGWTE